jgi:hypothetical protein
MEHAAMGRRCRRRAVPGVQVITVEPEASGSAVAVLRSWERAQTIALVVWSALAGTSPLAIREAVSTVREAAG